MSWIKSAFWYGVSCMLVMPMWAAPASARPADGEIAYVPTRQDIVRDMLWAANVTTNDVVYDLGSGDGRVVIAAAKDFHARKAVGIELDPKLVEQSREAASREGVGKQVSFVSGDLFTNNLSEASVVILYLGHNPNLRLRPKLLRELKPGARVVTHQFGMGEWPPDKQLSVRTVYLGMYGRMHNWFAQNTRVPDFELNPDLSTKAVVAVYTVPARIAGVWKGKMATPQGEIDLSLDLHQTLSWVSGTFQVGVAETNLAGSIRADLWGDHLRFDGYAAGQSYAGFRMIYDGHAKDGALEGRLDVIAGGKEFKGNWFAKRQLCDFTGEWEWSKPAPDRSVKLGIVRTNGGYVATFFDKGKQLQVEDFYDFGGGFYFTHMMDKLEISPGVWSVQLTKDAGWLIGEALAEGPGMTGSLQFFPHPGAYSDFGPPTEKQSRPPDVSGPWNPTRH